MEKIQTSKVIVRIPPSVAADIGNSEIIDLLLGKALVKKDLYKSKIKTFENDQVSPSHRVTIVDVLDQIEEKISR